MFFCLFSFFSLSEWDVVEWSDDQAVFTFLYDTIELIITFGEPVGKQQEEDNSSVDKGMDKLTKDSYLCFNTILTCIDMMKVLLKLLKEAITLISDNRILLNKKLKNSASESCPLLSYIR